MTPTTKLKLALRKALIELEYAQEKLGADRSLTRGEVIQEAKKALASADRYTTK